MKLRFKQDDKVIKKEEYIIPLSIIMYLNETYADRDISYAILHYFLCYLNEERNISLLESYRADSNEIKIELNGLSNKDIPYNEKINDKLVEIFCTFIQEKQENLRILTENIEELPENINSIRIYNQFCYKFLQEELKRIDDEQIIDLDIEDDEIVEVDVKEIEEETSINKIFSKYFNEKEDNVIKETKIIETSPDYEWNQTSLRFKKPDGTWGKWVDLKGASGKSGGGSKGMNREQVNELITYALDPLSASTVRSHIQSASYFSMSSGSINTLSASRISVYDLVVQNSNITGSGGVLSASTVRTHELSSSYFSMSSGSANQLSGNILHVYDLVVQNSNITGSTTARYITIQVTDPNGADVITGDGKAYFFIDSAMNGYNLTNAQASAVSGSSSGTPTIQIRNATAAVDMLSTKITIDVGDNPATSYTAATPSVIDLANDDVQTGEMIAVDVDVSGTGVKGLNVHLTFEEP